MIKKISFAALMLILGFAVNAQQKMTYDANAEKRTVGSFNGIKVSTGISLYISQDGAEEVAVSASTEEDRNKIKTEVVNGILKIYYYKENSWTFRSGKKKQLKAWVSFKTIDSFTGSAGSTTTADGSIKANTLSLDISSGAYFTADIFCTSLNADVSSGARATLSGSTESLIVKASSGGNFEGYNFKTSICNADVSSGGDVEITATKEITAEASSGGEIKYKGTAIIKEFLKSSGGSIKKED